MGEGGSEDSGRRLDGNDRSGEGHVGNESA